MGKELPVVAFPGRPEPSASKDEIAYCRVFCGRENSPPLRLLLDFLKSHGQVPLIPKMGPEAIEEWAWARISLGYHREHKPIQLFCLRDRGTYKDSFEQERSQFLERLSVYDDIEAQLVREHLTRTRFIATTQLDKKDITEDGYDFNGWILEFFQENCNGIVQIDGQGFFSPKGELIVELHDDISSEIDLV